MALTTEERDRIREEEWVRLQAREDFYRTNPSATNPGAGPGWGRYWGQRRHPGFTVAIVAIVFGFVLLREIAAHINWNQILP